jgi:ATP-dependent HslUV protease ATP-binding subunit HslU
VRELTPRQIVEELDRYIVGQDNAKRAVAIAIRNRWRRQHLPDDMRDEVAPKNIIMIGPTGVGKTEIARRLAQLTGAPFLKVEATKYTEVGYYGRDVESMIRDLVELAIGMKRQEERQRVETEARAAVNDRLLDLLVPPTPSMELEPVEVPEDGHDRHKRVREKMRGMLEAGELEERLVEINLEQRTVPIQVFSNMGMEQMDLDLQNMFERIMPRQSQQRKLPVKKAREILVDQEVESLIDREKVQQEAVRLTENLGIVFLDELDKICGPDSSHGPDVSRQGVQRDLLPIVEGTTVQTRYGPVKSDHILFIAAGAFHRSKPADLMPELQGRFPIRVELDDLTRDDFIRILKEPKNSLTKQYAALLGTEKLKVSFTDDAVDTLADFAYQVNQQTQNIGARRLHTMMEKLIEDVSFDAPDLAKKRVKIDADYVRAHLESVAHDEDLSRFIL